MKLTIQTGVLSAIADTATLTLAGGGVPALADNGFAELAAGVNDILAGLVLGTAVQPFGTYGSTLSRGNIPANDEFFSGAGILTVVPEPGVTTMLIGGFSALLGLQRFRRQKLNHPATDFHLEGWRMAARFSLCSSLAEGEMPLKC